MGFRRRVMLGVGWTIGAVLCGSVDAQAAGQSADPSQAYTTPDATAEGVLQEMATRAAVIFTGTIIAVKKGTDEDLRGNAAASVVEVDFIVDHAVQGVADGSIYVMREWGGLWRDSPRFVPGQRVLALLHAPGPGGLSSPVDGLDGILPVKATSPASGSLAALATTDATTAAPEDAVDMRWLQAKTLRTQIPSDAPVAAPGENFAGGLSAPPSSAPLAASATTVVVPPVTSAGLSHVLGSLMASRGSQHVSR